MEVNKHISFQYCTDKDGLIEILSTGLTPKGIHKIPHPTLCRDLNEDEKKIYQSLFEKDFTLLDDFEMRSFMLNQYLSDFLAKKEEWDAFEYMLDKNTNHHLPNKDDLWMAKCIVGSSKISNSTKLRLLTKLIENGVKLSYQALELAVLKNNYECAALMIKKYPEYREVENFIHEENSWFQLGRLIMKRLKDKKIDKDFEKLI